MLENCKRILLVRTDKIGDLILSTPALRALRKKFPYAQIDFLVSERTSELLEGHPSLGQVLVLDEDLYAGFLGFWRLIRVLRKQRYDAVVVFQTKFFVALCLFFSGIPYRTGPLSKWWSWIFWNFGRRQNRSNVEMHEAEYNIQLLRDFGISVSETREKTHIALSQIAIDHGRDFLVSKGIRGRFKTIVIHAGMAGSALNWPEAYYIDLGQRLLKKHNVVVTGGQGEEVLVNRLVQAMGQEHNFFADQPVLTRYIGSQGLGKFLGLLNACDLVVAPSTGPMHMAVALGKKVVTVFSPIKVQSVMRWGPYGIKFGTHMGVPPDSEASVLVPDVNCAEDFTCALTACVYYPCMSRISVEAVETQIMGLLDGVGISMVRGSDFIG